MYPTVKRLADLVLAVLGLIALSPVMAAVALAIVVGDPGPVIFRQLRTGTGGRDFPFYKFRSMPVSTDDIPSDRLGEVRITPVGRFIRRSNLDELPPWWNVVKGEMSLIGPRPPLPSQTELIDLRRRNGALACRPGLTGWAQVHAYDGMSVARKAEFDGDYARRMSLITDALIVLKTFGYFLRPPPKY